MFLSPAVIAGIVVGVFLVLLTFIGLLWYCVFRRRSSSNRNSETGSSDPSTLVEWNRGGQVSSAGGSHLAENHRARQFTLEELQQATRNFNGLNLVGTGSFGQIYKGLLLDGTVVAIKRRVSPAQQDFVEEVRRLSEIRHRNLVTLIGYCLEGGYQMLVYEYLPNGSVCGHLYGDSGTRLEFKQRLSIAIGVAKGLSHLHSLSPPVVHNNFKTSNVLVDENFIAKVADAGIIRLIQGSDNAGPSNRLSGSIYHDPEVSSLMQQSESSDVYSFGVFLLELISGQEAAHLVPPELKSSFIPWVESRLNSNELIDPRLNSSFTSEGMRDLINLTLHCVTSSSRRRLKMRLVATELDRILETEMNLTTVMGDGTAIVTLGSQLFTS
ncbi:putative serine/threonine-protein kinase At1g01540 [Carex rostrata]